MRSEQEFNLTEGTPTEVKVNGTECSLVACLLSAALLLSPHLQQERQL